jgi:dTDP-4-amino-4,6-dideoxygalactose transaminase
MSRDSLLEHLAAQDISARRGIMAAHRQPAYTRGEHGPLPVTERLTDNTLILPLFHQMTAAEQDRVIDALRPARLGSKVGA